MRNEIWTDSVSSRTLFWAAPALRVLCVLWFWKGSLFAWQSDNPTIMSSDTKTLSAEVVLGFLEEAEPWRLLSPQFPSKVGGRPAWLNHRGLPSLPELECGICRLPMAFLLQVSGPVNRWGFRTRPRISHITWGVGVTRCTHFYIRVLSLKFFLVSFIIKIDKVLMT